MKITSPIRYGVLASVLLAVCAAPAAAQDDSPAPYPAGPIGAPAGSGPYPAIAEARGDALGYTIYRPARSPGFKLPLVLWGNGGCRDNGLSASHFLREIASHGYFVVANGSARQERDVLTQLPDVSSAPPAPTEGPVRPQRMAPDETSVTQMLAAIDWAEAADADPGNAYFDLVDTSRVAALGHSCGGLQALSAGLDSRIDTVMALASGVYSIDESPPGNVEILQSDLAGLRSPVAIVLGGPSDIAYPHGTRNFELIDHVPVLAASLPVGHGGTFQLENGGEWAGVSAAWLDWQLKGSHAAARWFVGEDCILCRDEEWTVDRKLFPLEP
ncbi:hypothetical protein [Aurantiacibacter poecillastricola]|uniref:hypothetical protein n=1 Tax=Aurantiacibacter poecillastricola TaxID=3064385 RepID=UPI00273ED653|nr:hypothetical protein [Aurantiacibacter sp. 219JJ12-13]MDP5261301.1 hypothetical protein [Aurantiacibacter sp. 219JJ12-13]